MPAIPRQAYRSDLNRLRALCPDSHLSFVNRWEDVLDFPLEEAERIDFENDLHDCIANAKGDR